MRGVTEWVTDAAVWVTGKVGDLVQQTTSPNLTASWFEGEYGTMLAVAGALALLMLMLAVIQSIIRQDISMLVRSAFGYLPMAFILAGVAIAGATLLIGITDDISATVVSGLGAGQASNFLQTVGDAYKNALDQSSGIPLFGVFLGSIILAIGAFVLWLEMIIRDAAIYICVFFLPSHFRRDDLACDGTVGAQARRAAHCDHPREVRHRRNPESRHRGYHQHGHRNGQRQHIRTDDRRRRVARARRVVAFCTPAVDPHDGNRGGEHGQPALVHDCGSRIRWHPEPCRLHASSHGQELSAVDLTRLHDNRRDNLRPRTRHRAHRHEHHERRLTGRTRLRGRFGRTDAAWTDFSIWGRDRLSERTPGCGNARPGATRFGERDRDAACSLYAATLLSGPTTVPAGPAV